MAGRKVIFAAALAALLSSGSSASNYPDPCVALTARALSFIRDRQLQKVRVALVSDPANAESAEESAQVRASFGSGVAIANIHLTLVEVPIDRIENAGDVDVIWVTRGLKNNYRRVATVANREHALSVSRDLDCVQQAYCVLGVQAEPSVKIILSASAASQAGIAFQPAFRMMVTER